MRAKTRTATLPFVLGIGLTQAEKAAIESTALAAKTTPSEWSRQALAHALDASRDTRLLLAELLALRKIFILLQVDSYEEKRLTAERLRHVVELAETTKFSMAENRIYGFGLQSMNGVHGESK